MTAPLEAPPKVNAEDLGVAIRNALPTDAAFVFSTWQKSYRNGSGFIRRVSGKIYYDAQREVIEALMRRPSTTVAIACNRAEADQIYGWICAEKHNNAVVVHYVYVKSMFRGQGIGKALLKAFDVGPSVDMYYTHHTHHADAHVVRPNVFFNPYLAREA